MGNSSPHGDDYCPLFLATITSVMTNLNSATNRKKCRLWPNKLYFILPQKIFFVSLWLLFVDIWKQIVNFVTWIESVPIKMGNNAYC